MDYAAFLAQITITAVGVFYLVRGARDVFSEELAPEPSTRKSRGLTFLASLVAGGALGALGLTPAVTEAPWGSTVSGFIVGAMVYGGAKIPGLKGLRLEHKGKLGQKRKPVSKGGEA